VCVFSQDVTVFGGSLGEVYGEKIVKVLDLAMRNGCPVVGINEGGGARIQEGVVALGLYAEIFRRNVHASGVIPQISLVMGAAAGGHVYSPALTDFVVMVDRTSQMFITGPDVVKTVTGEDVTLEELGGARTHNTKSGVAHHLAEDEADALDYVKALLSYLPSNNLDPLPVPRGRPGRHHGRRRDRRGPRARHLRPGLGQHPYDMHTVIEHVLDDGEFLEVQPLFAPNILIGFGRVEGRPVGVVANQPTQLAGTLDIDASEKAARFVRTCDAFNIPGADLRRRPRVPARHLPGVGGDHPPRREADLRLRRGDRPEDHRDHPQGLRRRLRRHGLQAPRAPTSTSAWPTAQIAVMGAQGAVNVLYRAELGRRRGPRRRRARADHRDEDALLLALRHAADRGYVDQVIRPSETPHRGHQGACACCQHAPDAWPP
jgi:propionyl-CoA carboxylase beta chain